MKRPGGLSLLETILASAIFAAISIALVSLWFSHYRLQALSQHRLVANFVCRQLIEEQLNQPYGNIVSVPRGSQPAVSMTSVINGNERTVVYDWSVDVVTTPTTRDLTVHVFWKEAGLEHEFHLETLVFTLY